PGLISPTRSMLGQASQVLGCSFIFCTATQPGWTRRPDLPGDLGEVREIVPAQLRLYKRLVRVCVEWPGARDTMLNWPEVAQRMADQPAALCVVNTRPAALRLCSELDRLDCGGVFHLSTTMCPAHRLEVLDEIRRRLGDGRPCRLA